MAITDLIIGNATGYDWNDLKYWVNSIKKTGFDGDVVLTGTNMTKETIDKLTENGVELSLYGTQQDNGDVTAPNNNAPHVERFFYMWNALNNTKTQYRYVITTDTRDVVFQSNPTDWLVDNIYMYNMVASSEGMKYKNEPWGNQNLLETFGPFFHNMLKDSYIFNVGVIAGEFLTVKGLMLLLFQMSINRPIPIVDQAVYNFLIQNPPFSTETFLTNNSDGWAIQLGTTLEAVKAGSGDLGLNFGTDPTKHMMYQMNYGDNQPKFENGIVKTNEGKPFVVVHQYDRIPSLKAEIQKIYGE